jgi:hypothetical protein
MQQPPWDGTPVGDVGAALATRRNRECASGLRPRGSYHAEAAVPGRRRAADRLHEVAELQAAVDARYPPLSAIQLPPILVAIALGTRPRARPRALAGRLLRCSSSRVRMAMTIEPQPYRKKKPRGLPQLRVRDR